MSARIDVITLGVDNLEQRVDELLARVARAGGELVREPVGSPRAGYSGSFADPDGNLWHVASRN
jgi:predicted lactoylglutathione lyase